MAVFMSPWILRRPLVYAAKGRRSPRNMANRSWSLILSVTSGSLSKDPAPAAPLPTTHTEQYLAL